MWIGANALLIAQQVAADRRPHRRSAAPVVTRVGRRRRCGAWAAGASPAGRSIASGVFHGVLGAHLASQVDAPGRSIPTSCAAPSCVHALGDTRWFVGIGALTAMTAVVRRPSWWRADDRGVRRRPGSGRWRSSSAACSSAGSSITSSASSRRPGALLQAAWFVAVGASTTGQPPAPVVEAPTA